MTRAASDPPMSAAPPTLHLVHDRCPGLPAGAAPGSAAWTLESDRPGPWYCPWCGAWLNPREPRP
jgi:hypothetical protein